LNLNLQLKKTRKQVFLEQMKQVVSWTNLISLIAQYCPEGNSARPSFPLMTMLRTHFMQQWLTLSDPAMEESFFDTPVYRDFAQFEEFARLPDESTILRFRYRLEEHKLADQILITVNDLLTAKGLLPKAGTASEATLIAAPTSTKNKDRTRDPDMCSSMKGNQWYFGMKAHIGADGESGLVHTVRGTSGHVSRHCRGKHTLAWRRDGCIWRSWLPGNRETSERNA
jgi:IS5 family transposase